MLPQEVNFKMGDERMCLTDSEGRHIPKVLNPSEKWEGSVISMVLY